MKKKFIEPEIKRIELNLNENIASSEPYFEDQKGFITVAFGFKGCDSVVKGNEKIAYGDINEDNWGAVYYCSPFSAADGARLLGFGELY